MTKWFLINTIRKELSAKSSEYNLRLSHVESINFRANDFYLYREKKRVSGSYLFRFREVRVTDMRDHVLVTRAVRNVLHGPTATESARGRSLEGVNDNS